MVNYVGSSPQLCFGNCITHKADCTRGDVSTANHMPSLTVKPVQVRLLLKTVIRSWLYCFIPPPEFVCFQWAL